MSKLSKKSVTRSKKSAQIAHFSNLRKPSSNEVRIVRSLPGKGSFSLAEATAAVQTVMRRKSESGG